MKILFEVLEMSAYPSAFRVFAISLTSEDSMVQTSKANRMRILMIILYLAMIEISIHYQPFKMKVISFKP